MSAQNRKVVDPDTVRKQGCFFENPEEYINFVKKYIDAGFAYIYVHSAVQDQITFLNNYGKAFLPALKYMSSLSVVFIFIT